MVDEIAVILGETAIMKRQPKGIFQKHREVAPLVVFVADCQPFLPLLVGGNGRQGMKPAHIVMQRVAKNMKVVVSVIRDALVNPAADLIHLMKIAFPRQRMMQDERVAICIVFDDGTARLLPVFNVPYADAIEAHRTLATADAVFDIINLDE